MQGDGPSNKVFNSKYGSIQNSELYQVVQTGTVASKLTGRIKENTKFILRM